MTSTSVQLWTHFQLDLPCSFNRKEAKDHGEGGVIVGASLQHKRLMVIDDVITAGTAIRESFDIIKRHEAELGGVLVALDRQEKGATSDKSAIQEVEREFGIKVKAIVGLEHLVEYLTEKREEYKVQLEEIVEYRKTYGVVA